MVIRLHGSISDQQQIMQQIMAQGLTFETPELHDSVSDQCRSNFTYWRRSVKYDWSQMSAVTVILNSISKRKMLWLMVLNAADMSMLMRVVSLLSSAAIEAAHYTNSGYFCGVATAVRWQPWVEIVRHQKMRAKTNQEQSFYFLWDSAEFGHWLI